MNALKSVEWLFENQENTNLIILETSFKTTVNQTKPILERKIPNSVFFDISTTFSDTSNPLPNTMPSQTQFTEEAQKLGINSNSIIVVYDNVGIYSSPRAWWMFRSMGHQEVYVLNGGLPEWIAKGYNTTNTFKTSILKGNFIGKFDTTYFSNKLDILKNLETKNNVVIDARHQDRFSGLLPDSRKDARSGHIPHALNLPFEKVLNGNCLQNKATLKAILTETNIPEKPLIFSCGSGITACIDALAAFVVGYKNLSIYDGSWSEWGVEKQLPIEKEF